MEKRERAYWHWLSSISGIGSRILHEMLRVYQTPERLYQAPSEELKRFYGVGEKTCAYIEMSKKADIQEDYERLEMAGIKFAAYQEPAYPKRLLQLPDKPVGIYWKGRLPLEEQASVAIVGARECTRYGIEMAKQIGSFLGGHGIAVISGMARGIDAAGQWGALYGKGSSYAVLGCGVNICYPSENQKLYDALQSVGGIISEYAPLTRPEARYFPMRNRIISALSDIVVVVEAREKSGSLITVDFALEQGKDVYAVPGRIGDSLSEGCLQLIRQGAGILTKPEILLEELNIQRKISEDGCNGEKIVLAQTEKMVYSGLDLQPKNIQCIIDETGLTMKTVSQVLVSLQLRGLIEETSRNYYARINR